MFKVPIVVALLAVGFTTAALPQSAEEIVAANVAARGGLPAWRAVRTLRMTGQMDVGRDMQVPFTLLLERPMKMRLEFLFDGEMVVQVFDGKNGWMQRPFLGRDGYEPYGADELRAAAGQAELDGPLIDYKAKGHRVKLLGRETVQGREAYKLEVTLATGVVRHIYLDAETSLEVKVDSSRQLRGKETALETYYRDYRPVRGLLFAHSLETLIAGESKGNRMAIEQIELNPPLDAALFAPPRGK